MKKCTVVVLVLMFVLTIASTVFAAANAFVDVPANHWAYTAIAKLARDGVLPNSTGEAYQGNKTITRYEMAMLVANAMARVDKGHADDQALINKLAAEFAEELSVLGVHVERLGKQLDKAHVFGIVFAKYEHGDMGAGTSNVNNKLLDGLKLQLNANYKVNNDWSVFTVQEYLRDFINVSDGDPIGTSDQAKQLGIAGRIGTSSLTVGEFHEFTSYGVLYDANIHGIQLGLNNPAIYGEPPGPPSGQLKPQLIMTWGYLYYPCNMRLTDPLYGVTSTTEPSIVAAELFYPVTLDTNANLGYFKVWRDASVTSRHYSTIGFDRRLTKDISLTVFHGKSSYETDSKSYLVGLNYKFPDFMNPGSYGVYLNYERIEANAAIYPTFVVQDPDHGTNGLEFGYSFVPMKKTLIELIYAKMKATTANDSWKDNYFRCQIRYFF
ncbi:MAG: S-layer protein [Firmicutes bacterium]|nr:S-layer protein [Bacillota bacterium]